MTVVFEGKRHRVRRSMPDTRLGQTRCGRVFVFGAPCPKTPGHRVAMPTCPFHSTPTDCEECR